MIQQDCVWIVDDDTSIRWVLERALAQAGIATRSFASGDAMLPELAHQRPTAIISDIRMPGTDGLETLNQVQQTHPDIPVVIMTAHSDLDSAVASYQGGAFEYLPKPFDIDEALVVVKRAISHAGEKLREKLEEQRQADNDTSAVAGKEIIGEAPAMQEVFRAIGRLSHSNITVLINGASGTGKELVAAALHQHSPRSGKPFIALNMAAIPHDLIESELFGHEKGAFTGAASQRKGRFEQADGGTLFLDEIGDMPAETQTRLLRVLADGEFYRVGGHIPVQVDVRIIAATHQNLEQLVAQGRFREDLFHRLNVIRIHIPSLNQRREDIPSLTKYFLTKSANELSVEPKILTEQTLRYLGQRDWPGNVRQLENVCHWLTVMAAGREVHIADLPPELLERQEPSGVNGLSWEAALQQWAEQALASRQTAILEHALPAFERVMIQAALKQTGGRKRDASLLLGWGRNTLTRKIKELGLDKEGLEMNGLETSGESDD